MLLFFNSIFRQKMINLMNSFVYSSYIDKQIKSIFLNIELI
ncbi:hypothetical protein JOC77_002970 [Peribacillus deserti]|uniref:Uncharacterized protein n=1 Tax=Peribacillus deserti TaxID=673318 RepID=A0ABS2QK29_9BACI|nr:hypothetical protein [Peribacillus deserti]